jgi:hypothetical protein
MTMFRRQASTALGDSGQHGAEASSSSSSSMGGAAGASTSSSSIGGGDDSALNVGGAALGDDAVGDLNAETKKTLLLRVMDWSTLDPEKMSEQLRAFASQIGSSLLFERGDLVMVKVYTEVEDPDSPGGVLRRPVVHFARILGVSDDGVTLTLDPTEEEELSAPLKDVLPLYADMLSMLGSVEDMHRLTTDPVADVFHEIDRVVDSRVRDFFKNHYPEIDLKFLDAMQRADLQLSDLTRVEAHMAVLKKVRTGTTLADLEHELESEAIERIRKVERTLEPALIFPPTRDYSIAKLRKFSSSSFDSTFVDTKLAEYTRLCLKALDVLKKERQLLLDGTKKQQIAEWWLDKIERSADAFLYRQSFNFAAIPENYTEEGPSDLGAIQRNLELVRRFITAKDQRAKDMMRRFVDELRAEIYVRIDRFLFDIIYLIASELRKHGASPAQVPNIMRADLGKLEGIFETLETQLEKTLPEVVFYMKELFEDAKYIADMKTVEEGVGDADPKALTMSRIVPIGGLIYSRFFRVENELMTILDLWDNSRAMKRAASPPPSRQGSDAASPSIVRRRGSSGGSGVGNRVAKRVGSGATSDDDADSDDASPAGSPRLDGELPERSASPSRSSNLMDRLSPRGSRPKRARSSSTKGSKRRGIAAGSGSSGLRTSASASPSPGSGSDDDHSDDDQRDDDADNDANHSGGGDDEEDDERGGASSAFPELKWDTVVKSTSQKILRVFVDNRHFKTIAVPMPANVGKVCALLEKKCRDMDTTNFTLFEQYQCTDMEPLAGLEYDADIDSIMQNWGADHRFMYKKRLKRRGGTVSRPPAKLGKDASPTTTTPTSATPSSPLSTRAAATTASSSSSVPLDVAILDPPPGNPLELPCDELHSAMIGFLDRFPSPSLARLAKIPDVRSLHSLANFPPALRVLTQEMLALGQPLIDESSTSEIGMCSAFLHVAVVLLDALNVLADVVVLSNPPSAADDAEFFRNAATISAAHSLVLYYDCAGFVAAAADRAAFWNPLKTQLMQIVSRIAHASWATAPTSSSSSSSSSKALPKGIPRGIRPGQ